MIANRLLLVVGVSVYSIANGFILGFQLNRYFKAHRFKALVKDALIKSLISAWIVLGLQALYLVYAWRLEVLALKLLGCDLDCCPVSFNEHYFIAQIALPVVIVLGMIKVFIQFFMIHAEYHVHNASLWRMLLISNTCACTLQYCAVSWWL